jgi:hypothetical protein
VSYESLMQFLKDIKAKTAKPWPPALGDIDMADKSDDEKVNLDYEEL